MPRALIIGPDFYNFNEAVCAAFSACGYDAKVIKYGTPVDPYDTAARIGYKISCDKEAFRARNRRLRQTYYAAAFDAVKPDIVFILNGEILTSDTLEYFRRGGARTALWCFDSVKHVPVIKSHIDHVDRFYCYDRGDIEDYKKEGKRAMFLPQAADTAVYHLLEGVQKDIDILFVGDVYHSPRRQKYLSEVVRAFPDRRIKVVGIYKPWYKNPLKALLRERRDIYTNRNASPVEVNELYNRAKVVINIHNEQQSDGANPKVFEICASGAYQVCDTNPYIEQLFPGGEVGLYNGPQQLVERIREALEGDMSARADAAREKVLAGHTFGTRIAEVIKDLK